MAEAPAAPTVTHRPRRIRRWAFFALALVLGAVCVRLGLWQLDRLEERRERNAAIRSRVDLPVVSLPDGLGETADLNYRRATATGRFDPANEIYLGGRSLDGISGVHVVTPLLLDPSGPAILVHRGWISDVRYRNEASSSWAVEGDLAIEGLLLPSQQEPSLEFLADRVPGPGEPPLRTWRVLNVPGIAGQLPYPVLDVFLAQDGDPPTESSPIPSLDLDLSDGPHLGYALQWFAFAAIAWVGGVIWLRSRTGTAPAG